MVKFGTLLISVLSLCSTVARADDFYGLHDWSGAYVGADTGLEFGTVKTRSTTGNYAGVTDLSGGLVGLNGGYNLQNGATVFGVEADFQWSSLKGDRTCTGFPSVTCRHSIDLSASLRGRLGISVGQSLLYGIAGVAVANSQSSINPFSSPLTGSSAQTLLGLTVGAGVEYALTKQISLKAEYDYTNWSERTSPVNSVSTGDPFVGFPESQKIKLGVNYKF